MLRIVVLIKQVPDTYGERRLSLETGLAQRELGEAVLDEVGERALEVALSYADKHAGTEVQILSMSPETAEANLRKALAMGASSAVHVVDERLRGADLGLTAEVLAQALRREPFDLVIAGNQSTDGLGGVVPAMIAERLSLPAATVLSELEISESSVTGTRVSDGASVRVSAPLPAVVSVTEALPDARFPNFRGIMAAKKKPLERLSLEDLGVDADAADAARSILVAVSQRPARTAGQKVVDEGRAGALLASFLIQNHLA